MHPSPSLVRCSPCGALGRWRGDRSEESRLVVSSTSSAGPRGPGGTTGEGNPPAGATLPPRPPLRAPGGGGAPPAGIAFAGRPEREVPADVQRLTVAEGHDVASFAIVASGPNAASPHHEPTHRGIEKG